jgi:predicted kinase
MKAVLILIRGLPGSGKSTLAKRLFKIGWRHYEADRFHMQDGVYRYEASRAGQAHAWCLQETTKALKEGYTVIVSNTFTTRKELDPYLQMATVFGVPVKIIHCLGKFDTIHGVPREVIEKMSNRWEEMEEESFYDPDNDEEIELKIIKAWL